MTLTEMLYGILFQPVSTLQYLSREKPLSRAMLVFVSVLLFNALINQAISLANIEELPFSLPANLLWIFGLMGVIFSVLLLFLMAGFFSLLSEVFFGRANASGLLVCLGFASVPGLLGPPLQYAAILIKLPAGVMLFPLISIAWVIILQVMALRESLELDTGKAILLYIFPLLLVFFLLAIIAASFISSFPFAEF